MEECAQKIESYTDTQQYLARMGKAKLEHYRQYYQYDLPKGKQPGEVVNSLFDRMMRNDKEALEQVLGILADRTFAMLCSRLESVGCYSADHVDDLMQIIRMEIMKKSFRGFPRKVTKEGFYGYLIQIVQNQTKRYRKEQLHDRQSLVYEKDTEKKPDPLERQIRKQGLLSSDLEEQAISREEDGLKKRVLDYFMEALAWTDRKPYQAVTYGYAYLLPKILNDSRKRELKRKVNVISGRESGKQASGYEEDSDFLWGEITRKSEFLTGWAMDAMCRKKVRFLAEEFMKLYNMDPLNGKPVAWEDPFQQNMREEEKGKPIEELVITEEFDQLAIKNWPVRMQKALIEKTRERMRADPDFMKKGSQIICR